MVESFNGSMRQECLNKHWFVNLLDVRHKIEAWRGFYNEERPHSVLNLNKTKELALKTDENPVFVSTRIRIY
jgi:putative transposase